MRTGLILSLILISIQSVAADFKYKATSWADEPPIVELHLLAEPMARMGFQEIDNIRRGNLPHLGVDQIYVNASWEKSIFVKFGWKADDRKVRDRIMKLGPGFSYHAQVGGKEKIDFVFFFSGMGRAEATTIMNRVLKEMEYKKAETAWWKNLLSNEAHAEEVCTECLMGTSTRGKVNEIVTPLNNSLLYSMVSSCAVTAYNAAKGQIKGVGNFFKKLWNEPAKLWAETVEALKGFKDMVFNITDSFKKAVGALAGLSPEILQPLLCSAIGGMAPTIAATMIGVGASRLALQLTKMVKKLKDSSGALQSINKMENLNKRDKEKISRQVGYCAVK